VSPKNIVKPNMGVSELAEALNKVLPFTAKEDTRPVLTCVKFEAKEGKLRLISADGFRLAVLDLDYEGEGEALVNRLDLSGVSQALRKAKRVALSFETGDHNNVILDTELIRYRWPMVEGSFPNYSQLIPSESKGVAHFDTTEALQAIGWLKALADAKAYAVDITFGNGKVTLANVDDKGYAEVTADCEGEGKVRLDGSYLSQILRACGGAVDFKVISPQSPVLFSSDGFQVVAMPMVTATTHSQPAEAKAEPKAEGATDVVAEAEAVASEAEGKPKRKRKGKGKAKAEAPADEPLEDEVGELPPDQVKEPVAVTS
jgi:DNA polymerase III sliding clamp (beta) subunit (PCNA family)